LTNFVGLKRQTHVREKSGYPTPTNERWKQNKQGLKRVLKITHSLDRLHGKVTHWVNPPEVDPPTQGTPYQGDLHPFGQKHLFVPGSCVFFPPVIKRGEWWGYASETGAKAKETCPLFLA